MKRRAALLLALLLPACGGEPEAQVPIAHETPEDDLLRVGREWVADLQETGFRTPPSRVEMFTLRSASRVTFTKGVRTASEVLAFDETLKLSNGSTYHCQATATLAVPVVFGEHAGESAVELRRPALHLARTCDAPGFPEPTLELGPVAARFVLRGDRLVPIAPATERRTYLPAP